MAQYNIGDRVCFQHNGAIVKAAILAINNKSVRVRLEDGREGRVHPGLLFSEGETHPKGLDQWKRGDRVQYNHKGTMIHGTVERVNEKSISVDFDNGMHGRLAGSSLSASSIPQSAEARGKIAARHAIVRMAASDEDEMAWEAKYS